MNKQLDDELKRLCGVDEPDYYERRCARDFWIFKLVQAFVIASFILALAVCVWNAIL